MNISETFIRRPVMTTLVMAGVLLFGVVAYIYLPVSDLPAVDYPTIQVSASLPGASPETMAASVATPLEREFSTISGLSSMSSDNRLGNTSISLQFDLDRNIDSAAQDVQAAIAAAQRRLPTGMPSPPSFRKVNPSEKPIMYIALTSKTLPLSTIDEYGETNIGERLSTLKGVAQVVVYGAQKYAVRIQVNPLALAARGIGLDEVTSAIQKANVNLPTGVLDGTRKAFTVQANGQLDDAKAFRKVVVAYRNGRPVRLDEVANVVDSVENDRTASWFNDQRSVVLAIDRQPGANTVAVAQRITDVLPKVQEQLPASLELRILYDRSQSIKASVNDVKFTLGLTLALVVMVIFLFLRNVRATLIPSLALPMSIIGTFTVMYLFGYSLDNLSLMALTLAVGFVVDDAIVMLENIVRHLEMGKTVLQAALEGSKEIVFTVISMTLALTAVFIPVLFMGGIVGRLFHEFAVTIAASILVSGFVSLTLTPMLCSRFLKQHGKAQRHGKAYELTERAFDGLLHWYEGGLRWSLVHRKTILVVSLLVLVAMVPLFMVIPKGFIPSEDTGQIVAFTSAAQDTSFSGLAAHQKQVAATILKDPNVDSFMSAAGFGGRANKGILFIRLKPRDQRALSADEVINELRPKLSKIPGIMVFMQNPPPISIGGHLSQSLYQYTLQDPDTKELYHYAPILENALRKVPGIVDLNSDLEVKNPQVTVTIDRDRAATLGVTPEAIEDTLFTAYGSRQISTIYAPNDEYEVIMEVAPKFQNDPAVLSDLYVRSNSGKLVPLPAVASLKRTLGPLSVSHTGQLPSVTLSFNLAKGVSIGDAVNHVNEIAHKVLPGTISTSFQGTAQAFQSSLSGLGLLLLMAVLVIYMVLGILYESFIHPITILTALPFAGFGALLTLWLFHAELSLYAFVGIIMLVGLVKKNGIMMVDFAVDAQHQSKEKSARDAIYEACQVRFRPILMTSFAALMGTLPIAIGLGAGGESRQPLGLAVVGGLIFSQVLTLFVTPVFYTYMDELAGFFRRRKGPEEHVMAEPEPLSGVG